MRFQSIGTTNTSFAFNGTCTNCGTSVPEPGTLALAGLSLVGLALARRHKA